MADDIVAAHSSSQSPNGADLETEDPTNSDVIEQPPSLKRPNAELDEQACKIQKRDLKELTDRKTKLAKDLSILCYHKEHLQLPKIAERVQQCRAEMEALDSEIKNYHVKNTKKVDEGIGVIAYACQYSITGTDSQFSKTEEPTNADVIEQPPSLKPSNAEPAEQVCEIQKPNSTQATSSSMGEPSSTQDPEAVCHRPNSTQATSSSMGEPSSTQDPKGVCHRPNSTQATFSSMGKPSSTQDPEGVCHSAFALQLAEKLQKLQKSREEQGGQESDNDPEEIARCAASVVHACHCSDAECKRPSCPKMKRVLQHNKRCKKKENGMCPVCKQMKDICGHHARECTLDDCILPYCEDIRQKSAEGMATTEPTTEVRAIVP